MWVHTFLPLLDHSISHSSVQYLLVSPLQVGTCVCAGNGCRIHSGCTERLVEVLKGEKVDDIRVQIYTLYSRIRGCVEALRLTAISNMAQEWIFQHHSLLNLTRNLQEPNACQPMIYASAF